MVLEKENKFSIERFESVMLSTGTTWKELNDELNYDVETMLKNKRKPPMSNVIGKACDIIGLNNTDYVMMKSDTYKINKHPNSITIQSKQNNRKINNKDFVEINIIDIEMLDLYVKESDWDYVSLATLMDSKSILREGTGYLNRVQKIRKDNLNNICWALRCKISDICDVNAYDNEKVPKRVLNPLQKYILNKDLLNNFSKDLNKICKHANIPTWFINDDKQVKVSIDMLDILRAAIKQVSNKDLFYDELCTNWDKPSKQPKKRKGKKLTDGDMKYISQLLAENYTQKQIANKLGVGYSTLVKYLSEARKNKKLKEEEKIMLPTKPELKNEKNKGEEKMLIIKEVDKVSEKEIKTDVNKQDNKNKPKPSPFMLDMFNKIDRATDENLIILEKYIECVKNLRSVRSSLLE